MVKRRRLFDDDFLNIMEEFFDHIRKEMSEIDDILMNPEQHSKSYVRGVSIKIGPDGKPEIREFGNKISNKSANEIEPLIDVMESDKNIKIIAEVPGADEKDIEINETNDGIEIKSNGQRKYYKKIKLQGKFNAKKLTKTYKNGILEINIPRE